MSAAVARHRSNLINCRGHYQEEKKKSQRKKGGGGEFNREQELKRVLSHGFLRENQIPKKVKFILCKFLGKN